ncbi:DUF4157 domain-containing protein [Sphingomonas sp. R-74633]|uniref:eCIS core domain-containing protein n=1 Tax=Sphingomonas sp. R-74633 TaxID=2751188 RepID=UPI0015D39288|nr:DUF4157 domain-containing protein [Sphingomonas sp. R-74633]NYT43211.1 DUF4157 domain-containing protein [Sphingomonas sp. R-74633]
MTGRVIQGFFLGVSPRGSCVPVVGVPGRVPAQRAIGPVQRAARPMPGPPRPAFSSTHGAVAQAKAAPGFPAPAFQPVQPVQRHGDAGSFEVDPVQLGLARNGGRPLPGALLTKMEAAFGADFSAVRVHVGPQASRIGAIAFTTGNDLYFAPGRYQPDSAQGQQLIGHELAHVIQQRQGRVRAPGSGVAVVQDHALEAEADRLGQRAAMYRGPIQRKGAGGFTRTGHAIQRSSASTDDEKEPPIVAVTKWLKANDKGSQASNYSVGVTTKGHMIISKVGGLGAKAGIVADLTEYLQSKHSGTEVYLAPAFNTASPSGNHAEMCIVAGQNSNTGAVTNILCTHPNCALCAAQMKAAGIGGGSVTEGTGGNQATWVHPTEAAFFGTQYQDKSDMAVLVEALVAFNKDTSKAIPAKCGVKTTTNPTRGGAKKLI